MTATEASTLVQLIPDLSTGGAETMCTALTVELARRGHPVRVMTFYPTVQPRYRKALEEAGVAIQVLGKKPGMDPGLPGRIRHALRAAPPTILHSHRYALRYLLLARVGRWAGRWLHTLHSPWLHEHPVNRALLRMVPGGRPTLVGVSDAVAASLPPWLQRPPPPVVWNGIQVGSEDGEAKVGERGAVDDKRPVTPLAPPTLLWMGRLERPKRPELPLRALAALSAFHSHEATPHLLYAGDGSLRPELEAEARELGLTHRVTFLGLVDDTREVLARAHLFCLASDYEGSPMSVLEAQAAGLAVVASDVGGVAGSLAPENRGFLVTDPSPGGWAEALAGALQPDRLAAARAAGPSWVREHRSVERMTRDYLTLYGLSP